MNFFLPYCDVYTFIQDTLEKFGYLSKLGGKVKMWKRRWFVLRNGELFYYKSQVSRMNTDDAHVKIVYI